MNNLILRILLAFSLVAFTPTLSFAQNWAGLPQLQFEYHGNWSSTATYNSNDAVRGSDGKLYVAVEDNVPVNTDPVGSTRYWAEAISNRGNPGQAGDKGDSLDAIYIASSTCLLYTSPSPRD